MPPSIQQEYIFLFYLKHIFGGLRVTVYRIMFTINNWQRPVGCSAFRVII